MTNFLEAMGIVAVALVGLAHIIDFWVTVATVQDIHEKMSEKEDK